VCLDHWKIGIGVRIGIIALGTRGDAQPCVALARGLRRAGHSVRLATDPAFESLATRHGIEFSPVRANEKAFFHTEAGQTLIERKTTLASWRTYSRAFGSTVQQRFADCWEACRHADAIVVSPIAVPVGYSIAQKLDRPLARVFFSPFVSPAVAAAHPHVTRMAQWVFVNTVWNLFRPATNRARRDVLGLPPLPAINPTGELDRRGWPILCAYSPHVCPPAPNAVAGTHMTGYWFLESESAWEPPRALADFLAAGPPPVYVGFGSMTHRLPEDTSNLVVAALARAGQRGILSTGGRGLKRTAAARHVHMVEDAPHQWLFERVAAVVHHGGAGTTAAGLRAGVPTVIVPFGVPDQPIWGERVRELGVGPNPISRKHLSVERLSDALRIVTTDTAMRNRAHALGAQIRAEDGVTRAVEILQRALPPHN
jgi:sterol 3beta-glucosyltransferase